MARNPTSSGWRTWRWAQIDTQYSSSSLCFNESCFKTKKKPLTPVRHSESVNCPSCCSERRRVSHSDGQVQGPDVQKCKWSFSGMISVNIDTVLFVWWISYIKTLSWSCLMTAHSEISYTYTHVLMNMNKPTHCAHRAIFNRFTIRISSIQLRYPVHRSILTRW